MADSLSIVQEFCDLMVKRDAEPLRRFFTADAVYQNCGMPASIGVDAIIQNLAGQFAMFSDSYEYVMKNIAANGNTVLTERIDMIGNATVKHGVPVMGTFVLEGDKIRRWHDYFDSALPAKMMMGEDYSELVPNNY
jgi:limonene-1,2-epoxide hydrolase